MQPISKEAYQLFHEGTLALSDIEANGIRIDVEYCKKASHTLDYKITSLEKRMDNLEEVKLWKSKYGLKFNINSNAQLEKILFQELEIDHIKETEKGKKSTDDESLSKIGTSFTKKVLQLRGLKKTKSTYLEALIREEVDGFIHPFFGLISGSEGSDPRTYRGQSDHPNFQNLPIRDPVLGKIVRQAIIPRKGHFLKERDYKGIEVSVAQCYNQDPIFLYDIEHGDMHRDASMKCFILPKSFLKMNWGEKPLKNIRYLGKNKWVFPEFYGDWYGSCAAAMWDEIDNPIYCLPNGTSLRDHLRNKKIEDFQDFKDHLEKVEDWFWNEKYKVYTEWKTEWVKEYWKKGYFDTKTGFRCQGLMDEKQVINYPIQGDAFHCLLWPLIQMNKYLKKYKMKSKIVGQIHDCLLSDENPKEEKIIDEIFQETMTIKLVKHWNWITAPMKVEVEKTGIDESWWFKKAI